MKKKQNMLPQDFYCEYLASINDIHFTKRELDVMACIFSARKTSTIASFLSIDTRTVETHVRNIMSKIECNSRERIIDFIESSEKLTYIRHYYSLLRINTIFEKILKDLKNFKLVEVNILVLNYHQSKNYFFRQFISHLRLAGIKVSTSIHKKGVDYGLFFLSKSPLEEINNLSKKIDCGIKKLFFILEDNNISFLKNIEHVELFNLDDYYSSFFTILKKITPHSFLNKITEEFENQEKSIIHQLPKKQTFIEKKLISFHPSKSSLFKRLIALTLISGGIFTYHYKEKEQKISYSRSDLVIPASTVLLQRPEILTQIRKTFTKQVDEPIKIVALVGIGGSGKTTLARQYARQQKVNIVWEINAETPISLNESFENLAQILAKTDEDKKILRELQETKLLIVREKRIIEFVKNRLKLDSNWLLIYDNVEDFSAIQPYFPTDIGTWGKGKILLTTRNDNIQNNKQVNSLILTGELTATQKLDLFIKIMQQGKEHKLLMQENKELVEFLRQLPPFPLDISTAAYYLKTLNISYEQYLESLKQQDKDFTVVQENLLKEGGCYQKTRYAIITRSLENLIKNHKDFPDLLLLISLLDSQNIPRELLDKYKNSSIVDNFIYHLKKHSLITISPSESSYSIHRSTQAIALSYLEKLFELNEKRLILKEIVYVLDDYADKCIEQEDFPKMHIMARHLEKILSHSHMLTDFSKGLLGSKLGSMYYFLNNEKSKKLLDDSLQILQTRNVDKIPSKDTPRLARSLLHIGAIYTELRLYKEAEELFKKASHIYEQEDIKNYADLSWVLSHLGNVERRLGNYETAKCYLEKSIQLHKQYGIDKKRMARILAYLGSVYRGLGLYQKSVNTLEESLAIYNEDYPNDHFRIGWTLTRLGNVYSDLGDFKKAQEYFEKGISISKKYFPENHVGMGLTLTYLGNCYRELGDFEKSRDTLEKSLKVHQEHFDANSRRMGWISFHLGTTYKALGNNQDAQKMYDRVLEIYENYCNEDNIEVGGILRNMAKVCLDKNQLDEAENLIKRSLKILQPRQHIDAYRSLEVLGEICLQKSSQTINIKDNHKTHLLKIQAVDLFNQALKIIEPYFSQESTHIHRIRTKIKNIRE